MRIAGNNEIDEPPASAFAPLIVISPSIIFLNEKKSMPKTKVGILYEGNTGVSEKSAINS